MALSNYCFVAIQSNLWSARKILTSISCLPHSFRDTGGTAPSNNFEGEGRVDGDSQLYQPDGK